MTAYIIDTETTNSDPARAEIVELAYAKFEMAGDSRNFHNPVSYRYNAAAHTYGALAVHHILPEETAACPPSADAAIPADASYIIGHNIDYDWTALKRPPVKRICTLAIARSLWPHLDSHKLAALVYHLRGVSTETREWLRGAHGAADDVLYCSYVLSKALELEPGITSLEQLWHYSEAARIPKIMTFGKYKDQPVENVDRGWIQWYRKQPDTDPYLLHAFERLGR